MWHVAWREKVALKWEEGGRSSLYVCYRNHVPSGTGTSVYRKKRITSQQERALSKAARPPSITSTDQHQQPAAYLGIASRSHAASNAKGGLPVGRLGNLTFVSQCAGTNRIGKKKKRHHHALLLSHFFSMH